MRISIEENPRSEEISILRKKFLEEEVTIANFTLEELMMLAYNMPCRRISPSGTEAEKRGYGRGLLLIRTGEVVLVLEKDDDTLYFPHNEMEAVGCPSRQFPGILPGSKVYTRDGKLVSLYTKDVADELRVFYGACNIWQGKAKEGRTTASLFEVERDGNENDHRCIEAWRLMGYLSGKRILRAVSSV